MYIDTFLTKLSKNNSFRLRLQMFEVMKNRYNENLTELKNQSKESASTAPLDNIQGDHLQYSQTKKFAKKKIAVLTKKKYFAAFSTI